MRWAALALLLALGALRPDAVGRLLLGLGLPQLAQPLFHDPAWHGLAAAQAGDVDTARAALTEARDWLNLGTFEARQGRYAAALEAYDRGRLTGDAGAAERFDLLRAYYAALGVQAETPIHWAAEKDTGVEAGSFIARGDARAAGQGVGVTNVQTTLGLPELTGTGLRQVRKVFDDAFVVADERWLVTLEDAPGKFLAARLKAEQKRRAGR